MDEDNKDNLDNKEDDISKTDEDRQSENDSTDNLNPQDTDNNQSETSNENDISTENQDVKLMDEDNNKEEDISKTDQDIQSENDSTDNLNPQDTDNNESEISNENDISTENQETSQSQDESDEQIISSTNTNEEQKKEHEVIHKKDGRLHIYVRQDKYKGELKSKNWVGRLYIDGKQKISSSGTPDLEEAIPKLEKWFEDVHDEKLKEQQNLEEASTSDQTAEELTQSTTLEQTTSTTENISETPESKLETSTEEEKTKAPSIFDKLKGINFKKPSFGKKEETQKVSSGGLKNKLGNFFKSKLGRSSVKGEEILGVDFTNKEIILAQISNDKSNQWVIEKFYRHPLDLPNDTTILENADKVAQELSLAIQKSKITTSNAAIAIPVTSAIIRVVTAPLMKDEELQTAIESNSLWENLVQLTDNLDDYSIFHQVIDRNQKENTMEILFVASKLSDINSYTTIIKTSALNPVIIDVKCFALKSAVDQINQISKKTEDANLTAVLEFGLDENYLMILYNNNPIITDVFLRGLDRKILLESEDHEEKEGLSRRFTTQLKQAIQDFETKYEKRIRNVKVVSSLPNVEDYLSSFRKNLSNIGFTLFDPIDGLKIPQQIEDQVQINNRSHLTAVIGLAFRKLDVFGYYKFVTAVKNINLLPERKSMFSQKKMKAISNFAFKGFVGGIIGIYLILFALSFWNIHTYNNKLTDYDKVVKLHAIKNKENKTISKELKIVSTALKLSRTLKSNKDKSYRILAQIASSVPKRVKFSSVEYNGSNRVIIQGLAAADQDILNFIENLGKQKLIKQASLSSMKLPRSKSADGVPMKGFRVFVKTK